MGFYRKYTPSRTAKREFAQKMDEIRDFCNENGISYGASMDSYYFTVNGQDYRVSNHTIESSNAKAYNWTGEQVRDKYHDDKRKVDTVYIHAGKTRIIEIYNDIKDGFKLDGKGNRI